MHISLCIQSNVVHAFSHTRWNGISGAQSTFNYKLHFNYILQISYLPHINGQFRFTNELKSTSLDCERKLEDPEKTHACPGRTYTAHKEMSRHALASVRPLFLTYHVRSLPCYFTITQFGDFPHDPSKTNRCQSLREPKQMWTWSNWINVPLVTTVTHSTRVATTGALLTVITLCVYVMLNSVGLACWKIPKAYGVHHNVRPAVCEWATAELGVSTGCCQV